MAGSRTPRSRESELQPLILRGEPLTQGYGSESSNLPQQPTPKRTFFNPMRRKNATSSFVLPVDIISEDAAVHRLTTIRRKPPTHDEGPDRLDDKESDYLKSKLWQVLSFFRDCMT